MNRLFTLLLCALTIFSGHLFAQVTGTSDLWTWMHGVDNAPSTGVYGTQGVSAPTNTPEGTYTPGTWRDANGNFWMFGGSGINSGFLNDLWKYNPNTKEWTWMKGAGGAINSTGSYGTQGTAASTNVPPARYAPITWTDGQSTLWMFGGLGPTGFFNDLWKYDMTTNMWTWVSGANSINSAGSYGALGVAASSNQPAARQGSGAWMDATGRLWMFGGYNNAVSGGGQIALSDMWRFDPATNEWTWVGGPNTTGGTATFGTRGVAAPGNIPAARNSVTSWKDAQGNFWMFGGQRHAGGYQGVFNDLWKFNPTTGEWAWMSGSQTMNQYGTYGTKGMAAPANTPGARFGAVGWKDLADNLWLLGGAGFAAATGNNSGSGLNDLWKYDMSTGEWIWISGSDQINQNGVYGTKGVAAPGNFPGARISAAGWTDLTGNLWLFGGGGYGASGGSIYLNDLWRLAPCDDIQSQVAGILGDDTTVCADNPYTLNATFNNATYRWSTGATSPTLVANSTAEYRVEITSGNGCVGRDTVTVTVTPLPVVDLGNDMTLCNTEVPYTLTTSQPAGTTYLWSNGLSANSMDVTQTGKYWVRVSYGACIVSDTINIKVVPAPYVNIGSDSIICEAVPARIGMEVFGATYQWSTGSTDAYIDVSATGTYTLTVDKEGCKVSDDINITAMPNPAVDLGADQDICDAQTIALNATSPDGLIYEWNTGDATSIYNATGAGTYWVKVTSEYKCVSRDTITLKYVAKPTVILSDDTVVCEETPLTLMPVYTINEESLLWSTSSTERQISITEGGTYILSAINKCGATRDTISVRQIFCDIWLPNAFTPNGDGVNDILKVLGNVNRLQSFELMVFNRWGEIVFQTQDKYKGWNGMHKSGVAEIGTYVYMLNYSLNGEPVMQKGNVALLR